MRRGLWQLVSDTAVYSAGIVLRRGLSLVTLPVFTRVLTQQQFGVLAILGAIRELLTVVFELGTPNVSVRYYYDCPDEPSRRRLFGTLLLYIMGTSLAISVVLLVVGPLVWPVLAPEIPFHPYVSLTIATAFLAGMGILPRGLFRVTYRVPLFATLSLIQGVLTAACSIALVAVWELGVLGAVIGNLAVTTLFFSFPSGT